jgi:hypothetical protein
MIVLMRPLLFSFRDQSKKYGAEPTIFSPNFKEYTVSTRKMFCSGTHLFNRPGTGVTGDFGSKEDWPKKYSSPDGVQRFESTCGS